MTEPITLPTSALDGHTHVYAVPGENHIIDSIRPDGLTWINGHTLAEVLARYPDAERYTWDAWTAAQAARQQTPIQWLPATAEQYGEMLDVLPPIAFNGWSFLVGEPCDGCAATGRPRYEGYRMRATDPAVYETTSRPVTVAEFRIARLA
jgi:hypothetical protein